MPGRPAAAGCPAAGSQTIGGVRPAGRARRTVRAASRRARPAPCRAPRSSRRRSARRTGRRACGRDRAAARPARGGPSRISAMRSAIRIASSGSCVTMTRSRALSRRTASVSSRTCVAQAPVEPGERLVHQEHARPRRDGARQRHALLLAARQHVRIVRRHSRQARRARARAARRARRRRAAALAARTSHWRDWTDAETAHSPGTSGRCRAAPAARKRARPRPPGRRAGCVPASAARRRRRGAAASSCRSRNGRAAQTISPGAMSRLKSRDALRSRR